MTPPNALPELIAARRDGQPLIGAHRGAAAYAPENTLAAFAEGIRRGADMLELDIHLSREGEVVVIHDHTVDRTTDGRGYVHDLTVADLKRLDAGAWFDPRFAGERIPTLREVIEHVDRRLPLTIEVKGLPRAANALSDALVDLLEQMRMTGDLLVIAFDHEQV
ncbi:MAG: hypothetical protein M3464_06820, partial [Chloroflexota bacterium]|nr:hypothetical protein [Chloroflexota bacterium]